MAKDKGHDALGWRHGVGLLEKYSRFAPYFSVPTSGAEFPLRDEIQDPRETAKAVASSHPQ
ncbi:MAG: hypothetical protein WB610_14345 [Rhodomicrobium sp.]